MIKKEEILKMLDEQLQENEEIESSVIAYYKVESGFSGLTGNASSSNIPVQGILASTNARLLFYGQAIKNIPVFVDIKYSDITKIRETKEIFALFKSIPIFIVSHKDKETFTSQGDPDAFAKLQTFFNSIEVRCLTKKD